MAKGLMAAAITLAILMTSCQQVTLELPTPEARPAFLVEGKILFGKEGNLWVWENNATRRLTVGGNDLHPAWSPDGTRIAYVKMGESYSDILTMNPQGADFKELTGNKRGSLRYWAFWPAWSPDGSKIAYLTDQGTSSLALWLMEASGTGKRRLFTSGGNGGIDSPTWAPDGGRIAFVDYRSGVGQIVILNLATNRWEQLTRIESGVYDPRWAPHGDSIVFVARQGGRHDLWAMSPEGGDPVQLTTTGNNRSPVWSADSRYLTFVSGQGDAFDLWVMEIKRSPEGALSAGALRQITKGLKVDPGSGLSWLR